MGVNIPKGLSAPGFPDMGYCLSHIMWPDLLPALVNSMNMTKTFT